MHSKKGKQIYTQLYYICKLHLSVLAIILCRKSTIDYEPFLQMFLKTCATCNERFISSKQSDLKALIGNRCLFCFWSLTSSFIPMHQKPLYFPSPFQDTANNFSHSTKLSLFSAICACVNWRTSVL